MRGVLIVTHAEDAAVYASAVRSAIEAAFRALGEHLDKFEQTTHGSWFARDNDVGPLIYALGETYRRPIPYTVGELSQIIQAFLRNRPA